MDQLANCLTSKAMSARTLEKACQEEHAQINSVREGQTLSVVSIFYKGSIVLSKDHRRKVKFFEHWSASQFAG